MQKQSTTHPGMRHGYFYLIQLVPDIDPGRIKLGWTGDLNRRFSAHRVSAPSAVLLKTWPCVRYLEARTIHAATHLDCEPISREVFNCPDVLLVMRRITNFLSRKHPEIPTPIQRFPTPVVQPDPATLQASSPRDFYQTLDSAAELLGITKHELLLYIAEGALYLYWDRTYPRLVTDHLERFSREITEQSRTDQKRHLQLAAAVFGEAPC